jgi:membrane protease YdiL (CAAX protease family)
LILERGLLGLIRAVRHNRSYSYVQIGNKLMIHQETFITKRPLLTSMLTILLLAIGYGVAGTILYLNKIDSISPVFPVNMLLSVIAVLILLKTKRWDQVFLRRPKGGVSSVRIYAPLAAVLAITAVGSIATSGITVSSISNLIYLVLLSLSVGFIEELLFRGIILRAWLKKGVYLAVGVSTALFGVAHLMQLMGGQSAFGTLLQIVFSLVVGLALALVVVRTWSIWGVIIFHALFDFVQLISTSPTASVTDSSLDSISMIGTLACTIVLAFYIVWLTRIPANPASAERPTQEAATAVRTAGRS